LPGVNAGFWVEMAADLRKDVGEQTMKTLSPVAPPLSWEFLARRTRL
jgi:hypothetical protein